MARPASFINPSSVAQTQHVRGAAVAVDQAFQQTDVLVKRKERWCPAGHQPGTILLETVLEQAFLLPLFERHEDGVAEDLVGLKLKGDRCGINRDVVKKDTVN